MTKLSLSKQCGNEPLGDLIDKWCQEGMQIKPHGSSFALAHYVASKAYQHGLRRSKDLCVNTNLSPTAQAVMLAAAGDNINTANDSNFRQSIAAALRAAAEQVVLPKYQYSDWKMADLIMREIQTAADELEAL